MKTRSPQPTGLARASLFTALAALTGLAQPAAAEEPKKNDPRGELTAYDFDDDLVTGDNANPNGEVLHVRKRRNRESLVRARTHWIPELLKTADDL
ncbi:MAG TPA: hypothetical protein VK509_19685 [Polyangiales bacterium]|nr:hypothetical protein [Polyangiales bacterium]